MKIITRSFLVAILLLVSFSSFAKADERSSLISIIEEIYDTGSSQKTREVFDYHYSIYDQSELLKSVIGKDKSILKNKFVLWKMKDNPFGGYILGVATVTKSNKINLWRVWIYPIDKQKEEYEIREFKKVPFLSKDEKREFLKLLDKKYQKYWR